MAHEDSGQKFERSTPEAGRVDNFTIMDRPAPKSQAGIVMRVGGKVVGRPSLMGLEDNPEVPSKLLRHVVGEVEADSLEEDVTADWGAIMRTAWLPASTRMGEWSSVAGGWKEVSRRRQRSSQTTEEVIESDWYAGAPPRDRTKADPGIQKL